MDKQVSMPSGTAVYRNIGGVNLLLELITIDPFVIRLDINNPRISYPLSQLTHGERNDLSCELLLSTQEDTEKLKKSIRQTHGVQEPIYITKQGVVVEGNRRVVALRELKKQEPESIAYKQLPAWIIPEDTPRTVIEDLINAAHLDPKRPWAPFERALVLRRLSDSGVDSGTLADRYEMERSEIKQFIEAAGLMVNIYFPMLENPHDPQAISKFSYFLEYVKGRMLRYRKDNPGLDKRFCEWVSNGQIPKAEAVRTLPKIMESAAALKVMNEEGLGSAMSILADEDPTQHHFYGGLVSITRRIEKLGTNELKEIKTSQQKQTILRNLRDQINIVLDIIEKENGGN